MVSAFKNLSFGARINDVCDARIDLDHPENPGSRFFHTFQTGRFHSTLPAPVRNSARKHLGCSFHAGTPLRAKLGHTTSLSSHFFLCLGGRFLLSAMTRVLEGATPELRAARRASVARSNFFLGAFFIL
jgi:hypothetical protein